jgi:phosphonatase-like hydrolase
MAEPRLVVFDMAGTTVKGAGRVAEALVIALREHGIEVAPEQLGGVRGYSKREAVLNLIPEGADRGRRAEKVYNSFREHLARLYRAGGVEPVEGAEATFRWLKRRGVRAALNTGFDREITSLLISLLGWEREVVDVVVCGDDVGRGRPAPDLIFRAMEAAGVGEARQVMNVGDTMLDLQAGRNAGVRWNVGVLSGAHGRQLLEREPHTHLLDSVAGLPGLWPAV